MKIYKIPENVTSVKDDEDGNGPYFEIQVLTCIQKGEWVLLPKKIYLKDLA